MRIAEIYRSVQGEGLLTGTESVFVRTSGCNLRCWFCDTPHTSWRPEGEDLAVDEIQSRVLDFDCNHVVLTGGEPMLFAELIPLAAGLQAEKRHITIETAGTLFLPVACDMMSISPKLASSAPDPESYPDWSDRHQRVRHAADVIRKLVRAYAYQIKFVIDTPADCESTENYLQLFPEIDRNRVLLMPQGAQMEALESTAAWLEPYCQQNGLMFCPRRQIEWFGMVRGT